MNLDKYKPKSKGILSADHPSKKSGAVRIVTIRFTEEELAAIDVISRKLGVGKISTTIRMLLKQGGHI